MKQIIVKVKDVFSPDDEIIITQVGDKYIIERANPERILDKISTKFKDLNDSKKIDKQFHQRTLARQLTKSI